MSNGVSEVRSKTLISLFLVGTYQFDTAFSTIDVGAVCQGRDHDKTVVRYLGASQCNAMER